MAYQETRSVGYGSRVGNSFKAIGGGFLLFFAATALLWWNEGRAVKTDKMLNEAEGVTEELATINRIDPEMDGHLVYATGMTTTEDSLSDTKFGIGAKAVRLTRTVEYYQDQESSHEEHNDKFGGKEEIITTYEYKPGWTSAPVTGEFHDPNHKNKNFVLTSADQDQWQAEKVKFGAFELSDYQIGCIHGDVPVELQIDSTRLAELNKDAQLVMQRQVGGNLDNVKLVHVSDNQIYYGVSPSSPAIGDVRITWTKVMPGKVSIIARQKGNTFTSFKAKNGKTFQALVMGTKAADEIYEGAHSSNHTLMWILRFIGVMLVISGLKMIFGFLEAILKVVPFLANILGWGVGLVCTVVGVVWSLIIIALAWLFYRPLIGIILLAIAGFLIWVFAFKGKDKLKELASRAKNKQPDTVPVNND
jgi:hypothetical protein